MRLFFAYILTNIVLVSAYAQVIRLESGERNSDNPMNYIFDSKIKADEFSRDLLNNFYGIIYDGQRLETACQFQPEPVYRTPFDRETAERTFLSSAQYIGLEITTKAIAEYAKKLDYPTSKFKKLTEDLVAKTCSRNLTLISHNELKKYFFELYSKEDVFDLPEVINNPLFPFEGLQSRATERDILEKEFDWTVGLFKIFCSWENDTQRLGLMPILVSNSQIYSFFLNMIMGTKMVRNVLTGKFQSQPTESSTNVTCDNLICRRTTKDKFLQDIPKSIGSESVKNDYEKLYCHHFRETKVNDKALKGPMQEWAKKLEITDSPFYRGQLIGLVTGVPNFIISLDKYEQISGMLKTGFERTWKTWAQKVIDNYSQHISYEESLIFEKIERSYYFNTVVPQFSVEFRVSLGEYDRILQNIDKIKVDLPLKFTKSLLIWIRDRFQNWDPTKTKLKEEIKKDLLDQIRPQIQEHSKKFIISPWNDEINSIIADEIMEQVVLYQGSFLNLPSNEMVTVPVVLNYGIFAIKYLNYRYRLNSNRPQIDL